MTSRPSVANWSDKAENLRAIAAQLALGLDSFVLLDDNPVERAWVRSQLPEVAVVELGPHAVRLGPRPGSRALFSDGRSVGRGPRPERDVPTERRRERRFGTAYGSLDEFLAQLDMRASADSIASANISRVTQLVNKTNQFNLTTRRYTEAQIARLAADPDGWARAFHLADRFGDNGLIGVLSASPLRLTAGRSIRGS